MRTSISRFLLVGLLGCTLLSVGPIAQQPPKKEEPKTTLGKLLREKNRARGLIANSRARLRAEVVSLGGDSGSTPAQICCSSNIERLEKRIISMGPLMRELQACYEQSGNVDGELQLNFVRSDAEQLFKATRDFRDASEQQVMFHLGAMIRTFLNLEKSTAELTECPEP